MSDQQNIRDKIRKLLAVANNAGATEGEASTAMEMAAAMMAKYGVEASEVQERTHSSSPKVSQTTVRFATSYPMWVIRAAQAAAELSTVSSVYEGRGGEINAVHFTGRLENREMAEATLKYLMACVERAYKDNLKAYTVTIHMWPKAEQVRARAEFRKTFKYACASRLYTRAQDIMQALKTNDSAAQQATGKNALMIVQSVQQQLQEASEWMQSQGFVIETKTHKTPIGSGTRAGFDAGDNIKLRQEVGK